LATPEKQPAAPVGATMEVVAAQQSRHQPREPKPPERSPYVGNRKKEHAVRLQLTDNLFQSFEGIGRDEAHAVNDRDVVFAGTIESEQGCVDQLDVAIAQCFTGELEHTRRYVDACNPATPVVIKGCLLARAATDIEYAAPRE